MVASQFRYLFSPLAIRNVTLPNRIVSTGHAEALADNGVPGRALIRYHEEKARGGCGLIIAFGSAAVHETSPGKDWNGVELYEDRVIPHLLEMSRAIHKHGSKLFAQITHRGHRGVTDMYFKPLLAPSPIPERTHREMPHEMNKADIKMVQEAYAQAALRLKKGRFDGVEVLVGYHHLPEQFLSPRTNRRTDEYGGSLENRMRFTLEVLEEVRRAVGEDFVVGARVSGDEKLPGGLDHPTQVEIASRLAATGLIDYMNVVASTTENLLAQTETVPHMWYPTGLWVKYAEAIKKRVKIPVMAVGRITDPLQAEWILEQGHADFVAMTRALIADPHMPNKAKEGRLEDIRPCIGTNQGCVGRLYHGKTVSCIHNPVISREEELSEIKTASQKKKVVVVGGGPAGLEAARAAAERGHRVVLFEKTASLGGQLVPNSKAPGREDFAGIALWLEGQIRKLGVDIRLGVQADAEAVLNEKPDAIVIATGSTPRKPEVPGVETGPLVFVDDALTQKVEWGDNIIVLDQDDYHQGPAVAEAVAAPGRRVELVSDLFSVGESMDLFNKPLVYKRLFERGVTLSPSTEVKEVREERIVLKNVYTDEERIVEGVSAFIYAGHRQAQDSLYKELQGKVGQLFLVGDAMAPRKIPDAILEGTRAGRAI